MEIRRFGKTDMKVTVLGYGAMELPKLSEKEACILLNQAIDNGINFVDTSPCYGISEEYIGKALSSRRDDFILSTKCGCVVKPEGITHVFNRETFMNNIDNSLSVMKTDYVDILQIHAPMPEDIPGGENDDMMKAMEEIKRQGKIRHIAITFKNGGANDALFPDKYSYQCIKAFMDWDVFDVVQVVYGGLTRKCEKGINALHERGKGVITRGSMKKYKANYDELFEKARISELIGQGETPNGFLLRFTISHPGVSTAIVGTKSLEHLSENIKAVERGKLPVDIYEEAKKRLDSVGQKALE